MSLETVLKSLTEFSEEDTARLGAMKSLVYPPRPGGYPEVEREWRRPQWGVFVNEDDVLLSYTGVILIEGIANGSPAAIGGVGGVATHPDHRGRGHAAMGLGRALDFLLGEGADFALLVCREQLVSYYAALGWQRFEGELVVTQFGEPETFTINKVMVGDLESPAPTTGVIDLKGPPW